MKRSVKRAIWIAVVILLVLIAIPATMVISAFAGKRPLATREFGSDSVIKDGFVAIGVIDEGNGHIALIDAGNDEKGEALLAELSRRHLGPGAVDNVFLTHGHPDHVAAAKLLPNATFYIGAADMNLAQGKEGSHGPMTHLFPPHDAGIRLLVPISADKELSAGNKKVEAFLLPGHTAGSAAYLVDGLLFLGDSAGCASDGTIVGAPYGMSDSQAENRASLKRLGNYLKDKHIEVTALVCAHSGALDGSKPLIDYAMATP